MTEGRWALFIDVEGFSLLYKQNEPQALKRFEQLAEAIHEILEKPPNAFPRMGAHHMGDGFVIVSDSSEEPVEQPLALAIALMRHLLAKGIACKAGISAGGFSDIGGCLPRCIQDQMDNTQAIRKEKYRMTFWPVMGTALINAFNLIKKGPSGPLVLLDGRLYTTSTIKALDHAESFVIVDWIRSEPPLLAELMRNLGADTQAPEELARRLNNYVSQAAGISAEWKANALRLAQGTDRD